jgi:hypothetical protein
MLPQELGKFGAGEVGGEEGHGREQAHPQPQCRRGERHELQARHQPAKIADQQKSQHPRQRVPPIRQATQGDKRQRKRQPAQQNHRQPPDHDSGETVGRKQTIYH